MANIGEKAISILSGNLNSGLSYLITTVNEMYKIWNSKCRFAPNLTLSHLFVVVFLETKIRQKE